MKTEGIEKGSAEEKTRQSKEIHNGNNDVNMNGVIQRDTAERQDLTKEKEKGILDTKGQERHECVTWQHAHRDAHHICMEE